MRLKDHADLCAGKTLACGRKGSFDFTWVMGIIIDKQDPIDFPSLLKSALHSLKAVKGFECFCPVDGKFIGYGQCSDSVQSIVAARDLKPESFISGANA